MAVADEFKLINFLLGFAIRKRQFSWQATNGC